MSNTSRNWRKVFTSIPAESVPMPLSMLPVKIPSASRMSTKVLRSLSSSSSWPRLAFAAVGLRPMRMQPMLWLCAWGSNFAMPSIAMSIARSAGAAPSAMRSAAMPISVPQISRAENIT